MESLLESPTATAGSKHKRRAGLLRHALKKRIITQGFLTLPYYDGNPVLSVMLIQVCVEITYRERKYLS